MKKYLLLFHIWDSGAYSYLEAHVTKIIEASADDIQTKIKEATEEVNEAKAKESTREENFVLHQILPL
jgi:hypothetical protein